MTDFQRHMYMQYKAEGLEAQAEAYLKGCEEDAKVQPGMTEAEAREKAEMYVFCDMSRGDIEDGCRRRGIKVSKNRGIMEKALIDAITKEYMGEEAPLEV